MGFMAVEDSPLYEALGVRVGALGRVETIEGFRTHSPRIVVCGDAYRGASLVVWAIADGRNAARQLHATLQA
jgi:glutamate synthase (NADPH/NADH) small chain